MNIIDPPDFIAKCESQRLMKHISLAKAFIFIIFVKWVGLRDHLNLKSMSYLECYQVDRLLSPPRDQREKVSHCLKNMLIALEASLLLSSKYYKKTRSLWSSRKDKSSCCWSQKIAITQFVKIGRKKTARIVKIWLTKPRKVIWISCHLFSRILE
jgi:hypothetical protein